MKLNITSASWWGAPRKFSSEEKERKISWLELFYDLVYVIAIARITSELSENHTLQGFLNYLSLFAIIFWGWMNGSLYHDLHGSDGLRTRLMTLWQMLIISAMVVALDRNEGIFHHQVIITIMVMQLYITYLWWSVGIYDKKHRRLNRPYSILYILSLILFGFSLFVDLEIRPWFFAAAIVFNFLPPFIVHLIRRKKPGLLNLSSSMAERLGLFTIILFGEVIAGIVGGEGIVKVNHTESWVEFGLSVCIVFALWWIFFTLISDRKCKPGLLYGAILEIVYLITLMALGILGMAFRIILSADDTSNLNGNAIFMIFVFAIASFLIGIYTMTYLVEYPNQYHQLQKSIQRLILWGSAALIVTGLVSLQFQVIFSLLIILIILLGIIGITNLKWYSDYENKGNTAPPDKNFSIR